MACERTAYGFASRLANRRLGRSGRNPSGDARLSRVICSLEVFLPQSIVVDRKAPVHPSRSFSPPGVPMAFSPLPADLRQVVRQPVSWLRSTKDRNQKNDSESATH